MSSFSDSLYQWEKLPEQEAEKLKALESQRLVRLIFKESKICATELHGEYYGINDRCPHAGTPLTLALTCNKRGIVTCPTHYYKFDIKTGRSADGNEYKIPNYKFKEEGGTWYIGGRI